MTKPKHRRREFPSDKAVEYYSTAPTHFPRARTTSANKPTTPLEALMQAAPHEEPEESRQEADVLRELVGAAIDMLEDPLQRHIIELLYIEGLSLREASEQTLRSKTTVQRIRDNALEALQEMLTTDPTIRKRLDL